MQPRPRFNCAALTSKLRQPFSSCRRRTGLPHTAGSHLSEEVDLEVVHDNLGYANITTTSIYLHTEDDARHDATAARHRVAWHSP